MHTGIIIIFGLALLALMLFIGQKLGFSRETLTYGFVGLWLALTVINGAIGMKTGHSLVSALMAGFMVFAVPVAALVLFIAMSNT
ncbi:hypothetical protein SAMN04487857_11761 [Pseudomonas sp. ok272]|uniref:hypothetical protein n=1 Tax=unclassified Pseudomonas TaxID=196821 RepID=UPI0008D6041F|nr:MULTISPECIES: hypothetical protein [unclassified Pseudomonas]SEN45615.1 hypothetical protein SAMN04487857_11761 [Pseudomonas sp. ok272]SFM81564.1 hypothetical protein SAMN04487858_10761 [Pseudomonas sp. ok602]